MTTTIDEFSVANGM